MLKELWERFEAAVHEDDAELRAASHEFLTELKSRVEAIEAQLGITHAAPAAPVAEVPVPAPAPVVEPIAAPTEVVSQPDAPVEQLSAEPVAEAQPVPEAAPAPDAPAA